MIKEKNSLNIKSTMIKMKSRKKDSSRELSPKKISLFSKKLIFQVSLKLTKSKSLSSLKKQELFSLTLTKSIAGGSGQMLNLDLMNFPTSTKTTS